MIAHVWRDIPKGEEATRSNEVREGIGRQMKDNHFRLRYKKGPTCKIDDRTDRGGPLREGGKGQHPGRGMNNELGVSHGMASRHPFVGSSQTQCATCTPGSWKSCFMIM